jgi:hypothetical protein
LYEIDIYFIEIFPKILWRFHFIIRIYTYYGKDFFYYTEYCFKIVEDFFLNRGYLSLFNRFYVILTNINPIWKDLKVIYKIWPIVIPDIKIIQRISRVFQWLHFNFWKSMQLFDDVFVLIHINQILRNFMIILRNSKIILTIFNLNHITSNKHYFSISININNIKYLVKYFTQNSGFLTHSLKIYIIFQEI